jgi:hypothetical protein
MATFGRIVGSQLASLVSNAGRCSARRILVASLSWSHMSHIVQIETQVRDPVAVAAACQRLGLTMPQNETVQLFSSTATGIAVRLNGWRYPVVCETTTGTVKFDNFEGRWGDQKQLDQFLQAYAVERAKLEARRKGHSVSEQALADGSIKLTIQVAGGAT